MNQRVQPIVVTPNTSIRDAMVAIDDAGRNDPPAPWGIVVIMDGDTLKGIATDGDIRRAVLRDINLDEPISSIMIDSVLTVREGSPSLMLAEMHKKIKERGGTEYKYHHVVTIDNSDAVIDVVTPFELWKRSEIKIKTVAVIGLGYVGLTLGLTLNEFGIDVVGVDINEDVIKKLKNGTPHFYEKGLEALLNKHVNKNLKLKTSFEQNESDIYIICVGTPIDEQGKIISAYLESAVSEVGKVLKPHDLIILRSTVPIGTCRNTVIPILEKVSGLKAGNDFFVSFAPERTVEGKALEELKTLPQIIGGYNKQSLDYASQLFQVFTNTIVPVKSLEEAEAVKLLNNTFRDISFSFANEVAMTCDGFGLNARTIIRAANEGYTRNPIPYPSPGVGGACLVKDPYIFSVSAKEGGHEAKLPLIAREINESMIGFVCAKVDTFVNTEKKDPATIKIFLVGMAFKGTPETSDIRHSTSVDILVQLKNSYKNIVIYDPVAHTEDLEGLGVTITTDPIAGFKDADCILVLNNHPDYKDWDIFSLAKSMNTPGMIFDAWGSYSPEQLNELTAIKYTGL